MLWSETLVTTVFFALNFDTRFCVAQLSTKITLGHFLVQVQSFDYRLKGNNDSLTLVVRSGGTKMRPRPLLFARVSKQNVDDKNFRKLVFKNKLKNVFYSNEKYT